MLKLLACDYEREAVQAALMRWEGENPKLAETLMKIGNEASDNEFELRRLVAKLDPQALD